MHYGKINKYDVANGNGVRVSLFVSGCRQHCPGCFNEETWDFNYGAEFTAKELGEIITALSPSYISGLTILGGEPLEEENVDEVLNILSTIKSIFPEKSVWLYTGKQLEHILGADEIYNEKVKKILGHVDVLVDGPFVEELKDISLNFRGSSNQRIIEKPLEALTL